jgi:hypothetical protein
MELNLANMTDIEFEVFKLNTLSEGTEGTDGRERTITYAVIKDYLSEKYGRRIVVKRVDEDLFLIHNNFNAGNDNSDGTVSLFNETRSLVIKIIDNRIHIVSYSGDNMVYLTEEQYGEKYNRYDIIKRSYEGTFVSVFKHNNKWHVGTARNPDIDSSHFHDKSLSYGDLFDECLRSNDKTMTRELFLNTLDSNLCYYFTILHHSNGSIIDYTPVFGENYAKLVLLFCRNQRTMEMVTDKCFRYKRAGIIDPQRFTYAEYSESIEELSKDNTFSGVTVYQQDDVTMKTNVFKVCNTTYKTGKTQHPNYSNVWTRYLEIYKTNNRDFTIDDYRTANGITETYKILKGPKMVDVDISKMITCLYNGIGTMLYELVNFFTIFDYETGTFKKVNTDKYEFMKESKNKTLRKMVASLQHMFARQNIKTFSDIVHHLKRYVSADEIVHLLFSFRELVNSEHETTDWVNGSIFSSFLDLFHDSYNDETYYHSPSNEYGDYKRVFKVGSYAHALTKKEESTEESTDSEVVDK